MSQFAREFPELDPEELYDRACDDADMRRKRQREDALDGQPIVYPKPPEEKP